MSRAYLQLRFDDDGDGTGNLLARAEAGGFSGEGAAYFSNAELEAFARAIAAYPLPKQPQPSIAGGFLRKDDSGELAQEHLSITVYPIDQRGRIGVQVRLATELWERTRLESQNAVRLEIVTTYEPLAQFSRKLLALVNGNAEEAQLDGEDST